uniref:F-box domain-containing protein n=1 Tax=Nelumbo nucifera TaxID=4432 RepID=A0A822Y8P2_NELNU|nr:TPA_asm: hypothetical protein HUJ06_030100 [Nelumbo nucifera]
MSSNDEEKEAAHWSELPSELLWMFAERLSFVENVKMASVCNNWRHAIQSLSVVKPQDTHSHCEPWMMVIKNINSNEREFVSASTKEKYTFSHGDFRGADLLSSKQGWLLLRRLKSSPPSEPECCYTIFLVNPIFEGKTPMPNFNCTRLFHGVFTLVDGNPHCVVLADFCKVTEVTLWIARPDDAAWTKHQPSFNKFNYYELAIATGSYYREVRDWKKLCSSCHYLIVIGQYVYCFDAIGRCCIFDMVGLVWRGIPGLEPCTESPGYITENKGKIVLFKPNNKFTELCFFKLKHLGATTARWLKMRDYDMEDECLIFSKNLLFVNAKLRGVKEFYLLKHGVLRKKSVWARGSSIQVHNLMDEKNRDEDLLVDLLSQHSVWVDLPGPSVN